MRHAEDLCSVSFRDQARSGVLGIRYLGPFYFRYMVFFGENSDIKYLVFLNFRYSVYDTEIYNSFFSFIMVLTCEMLMLPKMTGHHLLTGIVL